MTITSSLSVGAYGDMIVGFPSPNYATHTIVNHLNDYGSIRMEMGYASAIAYVLFLIILAVSIIQLKVFNQDEEKAAARRAKKRASSKTK